MNPLWVKHKRKKKLPRQQHPRNAHTNITKITFRSGNIDIKLSCHDLAENPAFFLLSRVNLTNRSTATSQQWRVVSTLFTTDEGKNFQVIQQSVHEEKKGEWRERGRKKKKRKFN